MYNMYNMKHLEKTICMHMKQYNKIFVWEKKKTVWFLKLLLNSINEY